LPKIKTLLLTGENNHDWKRSAPFCRDLLESSGRFAVTITETPSRALEDTALVEETDLFFVDYNGADWSETARANLTRAVCGGTGVALLHAANNRFQGWTALEEMAGLMWREGTGHGEYHEFAVRIVDRQHPITRGLADFKIWDELYHRLTPMHGVPYTVLATAYADPERGGSGRDEPVMVVTRYGEGRAFHQILGHVWPHDFGGGYKGATLATFENEGFQRSLLRGCEWAATGVVTLSS
jgi:type 1 glutamine amidotransferase